jgi:hypothetical protein
MSSDNGLRMKCAVPTSTNGRTTAAISFSEPKPASYIDDVGNLDTRPAAEKSRILFENALKTHVSELGK